MALKKKYWLVFVYKFYNVENEEVFVKREDYVFSSFNLALLLYKKFTYKSVLNLLAYYGLDYRFDNYSLGIFGCRLVVYLTDIISRPGEVFEDYYEMSDKAVLDDDLPF